MLFRCSLLVCLLTAALSGQTGSPAGTGPDAVVATVNGRKLTAKEFERLLQALPPQNRQAAERQPRQYLEQQALFENILAEAEKSKLSERSPYKERLAETRRQILVQAQVAEKGNQITILPEAQKSFYEKNRDTFEQVRAKVIFISRVSVTRGLVDGQVKSSVTEEQSIQKAERIAKEAREGSDFVALAKQHSDDGTTSQTEATFPTPIRATSEHVPLNIRKAVLAAKPGEIVGPLPHDTGHYIFRIESKDIATYDEVKDDIYKQLKDAALRQWLDETKKRSVVTIENESYFTPPKPAAQ